MGTRREQRTALDALAAEVSRLGIDACPLVVELHAGEEDTYVPRTGTFEGRPFTPLVIVLGPEVVEPPLPETATRTDE